MATTNLGRVQGAGIFYSSATSATSVALSTITPSNITPLVGDSVEFSNGDVRVVQSAGSTTVTLGAVVANLRGPQGQQGATGAAGQQGGGFFSTTANSSTSISLSSISPTNITPLVGDTVFFANNGDIRTVQSVSGNTVTLSSVVTNLKPFFPFGSIAIQPSSNTGWYEAGQVPLLSGGGAYSGLFDITYINLSGANPPCSGRINVTGVNDGSAWTDTYTRLYTLCGNLSNAGVAIKTVSGDDDYLRLYVLAQRGYRIEVNCVSEYYGATPSQIMNFTGTYYGSSRPSGVTLPVVTNIASGTTTSPQSVSLSEETEIQSGDESVAQTGVEDAQIGE